MNSFRLGPFASNCWSTRSAGAWLLRSGAGVLLAAITIVPMLARIRAEEALLRSQFGAEYDAYRGRTSRLLLGIF